MKLTTIIAFLFISFFNSFEVNDDVVNALKQGKASELSKFFDEKIVLKILNQEDLLSKNQAEANLNFFFEKNKVKNFTSTLSKSLNANAHFITGTLETSGGKFRVSVLLRRNLISQLRIENENE